MQNITTALIIMAVGMGFVFAFLIIQVCATNLFAKLAGKFAYLLPEPTKAAPKKSAPAATAGNDLETVAVVAAALKASGKLPC